MVDITTEKEKLAQQLGKFDTAHRTISVYFLVSLTLLRFSSFILEHKFSGHVYDERLLHSIFSFLEDHTIDCCENLQQDYTKYYVSSIISFQRLWLCAKFEPWFILTRETIDITGNCPHVDGKSCESLPLPAVRTAKTEEISGVCSQVVAPSNAYVHATEPREKQRKMFTMYRFFCLLAVLLCFAGAFSAVLYRSIPPKAHHFITGLCRNFKMFIMHSYMYPAVGVERLLLSGARGRPPDNFILTASCEY